MHAIFDNVSPFTRSTQWRIQDFLKGGSNNTVAREARVKFEATPTLGQNHTHFDRFLRETISPTSLTSFLLRHAKVSHSIRSSFLSSVDRKGGSI